MQRARVGSQRQASLEDQRRETLRMSEPLWWPGIVNAAAANLKQRATPGF
jgi:hypothetical protein